MMVTDLGQTNVGETHFHLGRDQKTGELVYRQNKQNAWKSYKTLPASTRAKLEKKGIPMICQQTLKAHQDLIAELAYLRRTTTVGQEFLSISIQ